MTNVADKLRTRPKRWPWLIAAPATALLVVGTWAGASALGHPAPVPTSTLSPYVSPPLTPAELANVQSGADAQHAIIVDDEQKAAAAAAQAAADAAAAHQSSSGWAPGQAPAGTPIPLHLDNDPNSGSYGQMVIENPDQFCASNGGTTAANGQAVCS